MGRELSRCRGRSGGTASAAPGGTGTGLSTANRLLCSTCAQKHSPCVMLRVRDRFIHEQHEFGQKPSIATRPSILLQPSQPGSQPRAAPAHPVGSTPSLWHQAMPIPEQHRCCWHVLQLRR